MKAHFDSSSDCAVFPQLVARHLSLVTVRSALLLCALIPLAARAQTFTSLVSFTGRNGSSPFMGVLTQGVDGNMYGTASAGGAHGQGTVFKITPSGTLTTIYSFCAKSNCTDGAMPYGGLVLGTDGNFYGTTFSGGTTRQAGTVYKITPAGKLTTLHNFTFGRDGANPYDTLLQATDGNFYGTAQYGGAHGLGVVFKITTQGTFTVLHSFDSTDGSEPEAGLIQATDGDLYGTTYNGGTGGYGTAFKITLGGVFTNLHVFEDDVDGRDLVSGVVQGSDGNFYGTAGGGGPLGYGTIYVMTSAGAVTVLHNFDVTDGDAPNLLLLGTDGNLYGTSISGGGNGNVFMSTTAGTVTQVHGFNDTDGALPFAGPAEGTDGNLYGTTLYGGSKKKGTVFKIEMGLPAFVKTVPTSGKTGVKVKILGSSLTGATSVTFNGTAATFTVVSATELTTSVPTGATSGTVQVSTRSCALLSNLAFQVTP
jgi:uncharacterized repeat protein (TIGR03803 family)